MTGPGKMGILRSLEFSPLRRHSLILLYTEILARWMVEIRISVVEYRLEYERFTLDPVRERVDQVRFVRGLDVMTILRIVRSCDTPASKRPTFSDSQPVLAV